MANVVTAEVPIDWDELPLGYIASSHDGYVFEIDINRYNGIAFVRFPSHLPTLSVVREVVCALMDRCFFDDLIDDYVSMPSREYVGYRDDMGWSLVHESDERVIFDSEGSEVCRWK